MTHDFKKGDPVILEDGRAGIFKSVTVCIAEVEIDRHYKYVDVKTLKHKEDRAGEAVAELETVTIHRGDGSLFYEGSPFNIPPDIMADGCDPEPEPKRRILEHWEIDPDAPCQRGCPADDGPEVEILRSKP